MIHMLSSFDLKPGEDWKVLVCDYDNFLTNLRAVDMIIDAGPLGHRVEDTPMDTDKARTQSCFSLMRFRDRAQLDAAYAYIQANTQPSTATHLRMYRRLTNAVFLCWEDTNLGKDTT